MEQRELDIILALLRQKELHVRGLAKLLRQPHANISRVMKRLLEKNIVDFKIEGKNKVYNLKKGIETKSYIYAAEHYKLLKLFEKYSFLSVIIESILNKTNEDLIFVFGSFAKFKAKKESDVDVFIETDNRRVKREVEAINSRLNVKIGKFDKTNLLIKEIIKDHVIIKGVEGYYEKNPIFN